MNLNATSCEISINRSQIEDAIAMLLHGHGYAKNKEIVEMEINLPEMVSIKFKQKEVNTGRPLQ